MAPVRTMVLPRTYVSSLAVAIMVSVPCVKNKTGIQLHLLISMLADNRLVWMLQPFGQMLGMFFIVTSENFHQVGHRA